jgi:ornithine carbamoyltransferase
MRHFLEIDDLSAAELRHLLDLAEEPELPLVLSGRGVALIFEKPSVEDVTRTLGCYHAAVAARVYSHQTLDRMAAVSSVPIINLLSDDGHPMQALADLLTLRQEFGSLAGRTLTWVGDTNNVCRSLTIGASLLGMTVHVAPPPEYEFTNEELDRLAAAGAHPVQFSRPLEAVAGADVVSTDTWVSMGQEREAGEREVDFAGYSVDRTMMAAAAPHAVFLHCLPAHRGQEVTAEVLDGPQSRIWRQAENRMHTARAVLSWLVTESLR